MTHTIAQQAYAIVQKVVRQEITADEAERQIADLGVEREIAAEYVSTSTGGSDVVEVPSDVPAQ